MGKRTSIWIMSLLFGLGIIAAYHSDNKRLRAVQANHQLSGAVLEREGAGEFSIYEIESKLCVNTRLV